MRDLRRFFNKNATTILPIGVIIFLIAVAFLVQQLVKTSQELRSRALADNGQLTFSAPSTGPFLPGQTFNVSVNLNNGGQTVVGTDVIVLFDNAKLSLQTITKNTTTNTALTTYIPVDSNGNFDTNKVITDANNLGTVTFGAVAFDWATNTLTSPNPSNTVVSPLATLTFVVKNTAPAGTTTLSFKNDGVSSTTDSNITVIPSTGDPEDILQAAPYSNSSVDINLSSTLSPSPTPSSTPQASPSPSTSPTASASTPQCTVRTCQDFDGNGTITISDIQNIANRFNASTGNQNYSVSGDLNCNGSITISDIQSQASHFNRSCP